MGNLNSISLNYKIEEGGFYSDQRIKTLCFSFKVENKDLYNKITCSSQKGIKNLFTVEDDCGTVYEFKTGNRECIFKHHNENRNPSVTIFVPSRAENMGKTLYFTGCIHEVRFFIFALEKFVSFMNKERG